MANKYDKILDEYRESDSATTVAWGLLTGTLSAQTDLQTALNAKQGALTAGSGITITGSTISASGSGTVTSVSVTTANGVSGVVANSTTTPAITLTLGAITPTTVNGNTFTTGTYTLTGQAGKTLTFNGSITLTGTDAQTYTFPTTTATLARTDAGQTFTGSNVFSSTVSHTASSPFSMTNSQVVTVTLTAQTVGTATLTIPDFANVSDEFVFKTKSVTMSNKTFVAPALGAATATSINGLIITTTTGTLTIANNASASLITSGNFGLTLTSTAATNATFPSGTVTLVATTVTALSSLVTHGTITSGGLGTGAVIGGVTMTLGSDANYDMYHRGTGVLTRLANGTTGQVLTATTSAAPSWGAVPTVVEVITATDFADPNRFSNAVVGSGNVNITNVNGGSIDTGSTSGSSGNCIFGLSQGATDDIRLGSPAFAWRGTVSVIGTSGDGFVGIGAPTVAGSGITFTDRHIGFKFLMTAGPTCTVYATQGDGTTENVSSALTTIATGDVLELFLKVNGTSSVDYYWRNNGGAWSAATNLTTNFPSSALGKQLQFCLTNKSTTQQNKMYNTAANYRR